MAARRECVTCLARAIDGRADKLELLRIAQLDEGDLFKELPGGKMFPLGQTVPIELTFTICVRCWQRLRDNLPDAFALAPTLDVPL